MSSSGRWLEVEECSEHRKASTQSVLAGLDVAFQRELSERFHLMRNCSSPHQFIQFNTAQNRFARNTIVIRNSNTVYLYWCAPKAILGEHFVVRITGLMHKTPTGLLDSPRIADQSTYDSR